MSPTFIILQVAWWPHRNDPNVLLMFYEDLKECHENSVCSIAEFMGIKDEGCIQVALHGERNMGVIIF